MSHLHSPTLIISDNGKTQSVLMHKLKLLAVSGPLQGQEFIITKDLFTIGSALTNDLVLKDGTVSRSHCEIRVMPEGYVIRDVGSTNGTFVQGLRVTEAFLNHGTEVTLGKTMFVFCPLQETVEYMLSQKEAFGRLIGKSLSMRRVFHIAETYSPTDVTVLIEGETGTGKEVLAEEIHRHSKRKDKPFVVVDCATLARELIAGELFGHTKGAFTGAIGDREGAFECADGGTVFLDEIGNLNVDLQPQLLRAIEKKEIKRIGSNKVRKLDVRIISATNRNLRNELNVEKFREDLYFRLSVAHIDLPPLRKRKEDIPLLTREFLREFAGERAPDSVADFDKTMEAFKNHDWPGNVRELRNLVEFACHSGRRPLELSAFLYLGRSRPPDAEGRAESATDQPFKVAKNNLIRRFEAGFLKQLLKKENGNISRAARRAGIERAYLQRLVHKHGLK
ncbi:MAG: sigma 54-interacting transcriptional regulator [Verrucomicrobiota bacterium]|nr:sigma 54-interacting transcriptional regulator [Verrucomicrobiota bacterium]